MDKELKKLIEEKVDVKYRNDQFVGNNHIFILGAHIDSLEKEKVLVKCIKRLREFNIQILLVTHCEIDVEIQKLVDYFLYDDKNELLTFDRFDEFNIDSLRWVETDNYIVNNHVSFHHDFAALTIIKNGVNFAKEIGKKKIHYFDYDCIIDTLQFKHTFIRDLDYHDVTYGFLFSMNIDVAERIFVDGVTTLENHFKQDIWRFEDFLINGIRKYAKNPKVSEYMDNDRLFNTQAAWDRSGIDRNGSFFQIYLCVNEDDLYISLISSTKSCDTPTSGLVYNNAIATQDYLLEIKYGNFNKFHNLRLGSYDLVKIGKYVKNEHVKIRYMGVNVYDETLKINLIDYKKMNNLTFK